MVLRMTRILADHVGQLVDDRVAERRNGVGGGRRAIARRHARYGGKAINCLWGHEPGPSLVRRWRSGRLRPSRAAGGVVPRRTAPGIRYGSRGESALSTAIVILTRMAAANACRAPQPPGGDPQARGGGRRARRGTFPRSASRYID